MTESSLPRQKGPYKYHLRWFKNRTPNNLRLWLKHRKLDVRTHLSTYERGIRVIIEAKKGLTLAQIAREMNVSRQRVYQYIGAAGLKDTLNNIYQKRIARKRSVKLRRKLKVCRVCGKEFIFIYTVTNRSECSPFCRDKFVKKRNREKMRRLMNNPLYKARVMARRRFKARLDKPE